ncbi:MAG: AI-2E family transporter [Acetobacteraceae bacterium]
MSGTSGRGAATARPPLPSRDQPLGILRSGAEARDPVRTIAHILRATFIILGLCALLWALASAFVVIILAVIMAVLLRGVGNWVSHHTRLGATASVLLVFLALVLAICGLGYWAGPRFATQAQELWSKVSGGLGTISNMFGYHVGVEGISGGAGSAAQLLSGHAGVIGGMLKMVASSFIGLLAAILVILATGVYLAIAPDTYVNGISHLTPLWYQERTRQIMHEMGDAVRGWMLGQLIDMVIVGVIVGVGLWAIGTPLAGILAILAAVLTFIPYFGTIISVIPAIAVGLTMGVREVIWVVAVYIVAHTIEGYVIAPFVQRRTVHLPPALTLVSFVVMVAIFNIFGVLIATPLMACIMVGVTRVYVEDVLGDPAGRSLSVRSHWYWLTPPTEANG